MSEEVIKSRWALWLNRFRVRLPLILLGALLLLVEPAWYLWGVPFLLLGGGLRTWAVGYIYKDKELATKGPYSICRHPLYLGTLLSSIGVCVIVGSWLAGLIFSLVYILVYLPTMRHEEDYLRKVYGDAFHDYAERVPAFIPRLRPADIKGPGKWSWHRLLHNEEHLTWIAILLFFFGMAVKQHFF